ncbi:unnamed protein product [Pleuronectes platessa]|uniref:Uncharacterized protein n=1 Tax=Pleuronectes platessa TaxID=8262 RepID=A0A9N7U9K4_PLEPL|nr:unnamed protein product [Pleuronectes platessa]
MHFVVRTLTPCEELWVTRVTWALGVVERLCSRHPEVLWSGASSERNRRSRRREVTDQRRRRERQMGQGRSSMCPQVILMGLDSAGKSTLLARLLTGQVMDTSPNHWIQRGNIGHGQEDVSDRVGHRRTEEHETKLEVLPGRLQGAGLCGRQQRPQAHVRGSENSEEDSE